MVNHLVFSWFALFFTVLGAHGNINGVAWGEGTVYFNGRN